MSQNILLPFYITYLYEMAFSVLITIKSEYWSTLENIGGILQLIVSKPHRFNSSCQNAVKYLLSFMVNKW